MPICFLMREKKKKSVDLDGWGNWEEMGERKPYSEYIV